ncbi:MAG: hypothetical protein DRI37_06820 [Chloroflexi bacterium]|nr:MAG: hypothetical protein DRI37_06820 [Chloroflexota bacterium]
MAMMIPNNNSKTAHSSDVPLLEAASVNGKIAASYVTIAAGYTVGGFKSLASAAMTHAAKNKGGHVDNLLTKGIKEHYTDAEESGFALVEAGKDLVDFDFNIGTSGKTNAKPNNTNNTKGA